MTKLAYIAYKNAKNALSKGDGKGESGLERCCG
jgi:hypothetical protein